MLATKHVYATGDDNLVTMGVNFCYTGFDQAFNVSVLEAFGRLLLVSRLLYRELR